MLARELQSFGASEVRERKLGVEFSGPLQVAYRACLESRVASRVFLVVAEFEAGDEAQFYEAARAIDWNCESVAEMPRARPATMSTVSTRAAVTSCAPRWSAAGT